jgi:hypothetical protein
MVSTTVSSSFVLNRRREDDAVVSYRGLFEPAVAVSLASTWSSEPATKLRSGRSYTTSGDATRGGCIRPVSPLQVLLTKLRRVV